MSAPLVWIGAPLAIAVVAWFLQNRQKIALSIVIASCLFLMAAAWFIPIGTPIQLGPFLIELQSTFQILGRKFIIGPENRYFLLLIYFFGAFWFSGSAVIPTSRYFAPLGMAMIALSVAALSVQPFLYAALIIEMIVLLSIPLLVPPGQRVGQGVMRYLIFQTLAMPFVLIAGWLSSKVEANPTDSILLLQMMVVLGLGFAFWLAIFPFYSWMPLLVGETKPFSAGFVLTLLPTIMFLLVLDFYNAFSWLRDFSMLAPILQTAGTLMIVTGGIWAAFQKDASRLFGYAVIIENGFSLLALSLGTVAGMQIYVSLFAPRILALAIFALCLSILGQSNTFKFSSLRGVIRRFPLTGTAFIIACFSLAGLPLLASFPIREVLLENLAVHSLPIVMWVLVGVLGYFIACFRLAGVLILPEETEWNSSEKWPHSILLIIGVTLLLLMGIAPNIIFPPWFNLLMPYVNLF